MHPQAGRVSSSCSTCATLYEEKQEQGGMKVEEEQESCTGMEDKVKDKPDLALMEQGRA